ncbi:hypothetical protein DOTSEDRAFT_72438 [Dothistroma septosporum NZE10]|uniref:Uncharacterized protein n=1 Tax=Dothistroma septosporum (strain NZE10 / CBS 128990) TaxID=675120 RepID=M2YMA5_DOTSN|nr:hypothetical protein DOTSEDRAFT_72438 [Dothistroma septosporum NZE10]
MAEDRSSFEVWDGLSCAWGPAEHVAIRHIRCSNGYLWVRSGSVLPLPISRPPSSPSGIRPPDPNPDQLDHLRQNITLNQTHSPRGDPLEKHIFIAFPPDRGSQDRPHPVAKAQVCILKNDEQQRQGEEGLDCGVARFREVQVLEDLI